ncbi:MAG: hypothetical protein HY255_05610, partial [Betaproteobacteria bacterium]|nr:hypothetical protein [Betaproteobacteria bacterium]
ELGGVLIWCEVFGISGELFWPEHPAWEFTSILVGLAMSTLGVPYFVRYYLDTRRYFPRADSLLRWTVYAGLSLLVLGLALYGIRLWNNIGLLAFAIVGLPPILASFLVIVLALRRRHPQAKHLFLAGLVGVIAVFITSAESFKLLPATDWTIHATQAGNAIAGIILSMGLGFRLRHTRKELAERKIAEAQAQSRHERETRELVEAHNRDLEKKVVERTAELVALRQQSDLLLANILPTAIIDELKENGSSEPRRHEEVSILFTDFSAFTQTVSTMPPKRLVQELDEIFRGFDDIVAEHGLEKIKTIGDAYMAASGLPVACSDHALRCARAGLAMTRFIEARNRRAAIKWGLRVGVHSGAVVAGVVGKNKYAYDVWGDTVNIANRLESAGETDKVNVSAYTFELIREQFECEYRGKLTAKGKGEIDMYFVLREAGTR